MLWSIITWHQEKQQNYWLKQARTIISKNSVCHLYFVLHTLSSTETKSISARSQCCESLKVSNEATSWKVTVFNEPDFMRAVCWKVTKSITTKKGDTWAIQWLIMCNRVFYTPLASHQQKPTTTYSSDHFWVSKNKAAVLPFVKSVISKTAVLRLQEKQNVTSSE